MKHLGCYLAGTLFLAVASVVLLLPSGSEAVESHRYADGVLSPRFHADFNAWTYQHPRDRQGHEGEHCQNLDAGDVKRWHVARASFRSLDEAMKRAGY